MSQTQTKAPSPLRSAGALHDLPPTDDRALIGTSGFGIAQADHVRKFSCVEIQHTFYQPPRIATLERWRANAPADFEFVLKAWQLITHDSKSPTYRRLKKQLTKREKREAGYFRDTSVVKEAWAVTRAAANALRARTILFQCPASFNQTEENISNLEKFFKTVKRDKKTDGLNFCWEPRGDWDPKVIKTICNNLNLWHAVDPFIAESVTPARRYFRLHGRNGWRYEYDESELRELAAIVMRRPKLTSPEIQAPYVFFNNARMTQDALKFQAMIRGA